MSKLKITSKMSLVAYDLSGESDVDDNIEEDPVYGKRKKIEDVSDTKISFNSLPKPAVPDRSIVPKEDENIPVIKEQCLEEKPKKIKQPVKIVIPSLNQFTDCADSEELPKKSKPQKASGLFGVLPPPKQTPLSATSFIPSRLLKPKQPSQKPKNPLQEKLKKISELESDDEDLSELPESFDDAMWQKVCGRKKKITKPVPVIQPIINSAIIEPAPEAAEPNNTLDNEAFKELVGNSKKKVNIKLIDISEEEILPDKEVWMTKSLTDPTCAPKYEITDPVNNTCKKKHHITYLAQQAKANEQELQNQWAANRFSRKQTQAKYGF